MVHSPLTHYSCKRCPVLVARQPPIIMTGKDARRSGSESHGNWAFVTDPAASLRGIRGSHVTRVRVRREDLHGRSCRQSVHEHSEHAFNRDDQAIGAPEELRPAVPVPAPLL